MNGIVDLHMHVVPCIDDGSQSIEESMQMLKLAAEQGVTDVFCTSHNGCCKEDGERYMNAFIQLENAAEEAKINIKIHKGCELLCSEEHIDDIIYGLNIGSFSTLGNSKYVLTELHPDAEAGEVLTIIRALAENGYKPIFAHMERANNITNLIVRLLIESGVFIQVNTFSFVDEADAKIRERARELLRNK